MQDETRKLVAIVAADVVGYSRLVSADEDGTLRALRGHRRDFIDPLVERAGGRIANTAGDSLLLEFTSAVEAVKFAVAMQDGMIERNRDIVADRQIVFRIGINIGDVIAEGNDMLGDSVNVAARLEALADAGGICVSRTVRDQLRDRLSLNFRDRGEIAVKNIARPIHVFDIVRDGGSPGRQPRQAQMIRRLATAAVALTAAIAVALFIWWSPWQDRLGSVPKEAEALPPTDRPSIAILPFQNLNDSDAQSYFADGLTDDLITDLSKLSGLFVIARNTVFSYKDKSIPSTGVAKELGVTHIVEGSIRRAGDRIRVNARLVEGKNGHQVWAERYDREAADVFQVQDELVRQIVTALAVRLTTQEENILQPRSTPDLQAYDLYLRARAGFYSRDQSRMRESLALYAEAWTIDPGFARAYSGYAQLAADIWRLSSLREAIGGTTARVAAEGAAQKALELDRNLAEAHSVLALLRMTETNFDKAMDYARRAVALEPSSADAHTALAIVLGYAGQPEAALKAARTAIQLNPRPAPYHLTYYGWTLFLNKLYDAAIEALLPIGNTRDRGLGDSPHEILAMSYAMSGDAATAAEQVRLLLASEPFLNVSYFRVLYDHMARPEDIRHRLTAIAKAGLPEWPFNYKGADGDRVRGRELLDLVNSKTWSGRDIGRQSPFIQELAKDNSSVYAGESAILNGTAFVEDDKICEIYRGFVLAKPLCGPVFRLSADNANNQYAYVYVNPATLREFNLAE